MTDINFKKALKEASEWEFYATEYEKSEISYAEARKAVLERIFIKYCDCKNHFMSF